MSPARMDEFERAIVRRDAAGAAYYGTTMTPEAQQLRADNAACLRVHGIGWPIRRAGLIDLVLRRIRDRWRAHVARLRDANLADRW